MPEQAKADLFSLLASVKRFTIQVDSNNTKLANGQGDVKVEKIRARQIIWRESGYWDKSFNSLAFSNVYRWSWEEQNSLTLEHLRYGEHLPVELVNLKLGSDCQWQCDPYYCSDDVYQLEVSVLTFKLKLQWHIKGPKKDQMTTLYYS